MGNTLLNILQVTASFLGNFLYELLVTPSKAIIKISADYFSSTELTFVSFIGYFVVFLGLSFLVKLTFHIFRTGIAYAILLRKEKKREQVEEIKRQAVMRAEARAADNREFDELYARYVTSVDEEA